jgi:hypothetical protein
VHVPFKVLRGMASIGAIRDRLDIEDIDLAELQALGSEGLETSGRLAGQRDRSSPRWSAIYAPRSVTEAR